MKKLNVTGIANETDFATKDSKFLLVLNDGLFRIPVFEAQATEVIKYMFDEEEEKEPEEEFKNERYNEEDEEIGQI